MRVNVYSEELTDRVEFRTKIADTGMKFYGVSFYLLSSDELHSSQTDNDASAVTFWADTPEKLQSLMRNALEQIPK